MNIHQCWRMRISTPIGGKVVLWNKHLRIFTCFSLANYCTCTKSSPEHTLDCRKKTLCILKGYKINIQDKRIQKCYSILPTNLIYLASDSFKKTYADLHVSLSVFPHCISPYQIPKHNYNHVSLPRQIMLSKICIIAKKIWFMCDFVLHFGIVLVWILLRSRPWESDLSVRDLAL